MAFVRVTAMSQLSYLAPEAECGTCISGYSQMSEETDNPHVYVECSMYSLNNT